MTRLKQEWRRKRGIGIGIGRDRGIRLGIWYQI
jgi:hypothetical protein